MRYKGFLAVGIKLALASGFVFWAIAPREPPQQPITATSTFLTLGPSSNFHIADPNEPIPVNGKVVRVADLEAALVAINILLEPRPRTQETRSRETNGRVA